MTLPSLEARARGRAKAAANAAARKRRAKPPITDDPKSLDEVRQLAAWAAFSLSTGTLETDRGRAVAQLCGVLLKVFLADQTEKLRELEGIVRRLQQQDAERAKAERG